MDDPMHANLFRELKACLAQKASEAPRTLLNIGFGLGSSSSVAPDSSNSPRYFTPDTGPSWSADCWDSLGRPSSGPASSPRTFSFANPLYADCLPTRPVMKSKRRVLLLIVDRLRSTTAIHLQGLYPHPTKSGTHQRILLMWTP